MDLLEDLARYITYRIQRLALTLEDEPQSFQTFR